MNVQSVLDDMGVNYRVSHHPTAYTAQMLAEAEHVPGRKVIKPVVVRDGEFVMCDLPACYRVDLGELKDQLQADDVKLVERTKLSELFPDCEVGAVPPIGRIYGMTTLMDESLVADDRVTFQAGTHEDAVTMSLAEYRRVASRSGPLRPAGGVRKRQHGGTECTEAAGVTRLRSGSPVAASVPSLPVRASAAYVIRVRRQVQHFRRAEEAHGQPGEAEAAVDDQPRPVDPVDAAAQAAGRGSRGGGSGIPRAGRPGRRACGRRGTGPAGGGTARGAGGRGSGTCTIRSVSSRRRGIELDEFVAAARSVGARQADQLDRRLPPPAPGLPAASVDQLHRHVCAPRRPLHVARRGCRGCRSTPSRAGNPFTSRSTIGRAGR